MLDFPHKIRTWWREFTQPDNGPSAALEEADEMLRESTRTLERVATDELSEFERRSILRTLDQRERKRSNR